MMKVFIANRGKREKSDYSVSVSYLTRKQYEVEIVDKIRKVPVVCKCEKSIKNHPVQSQMIL